MILFKDISQWNSAYNMAANPDPAIAIKMSGGDAGLYFDSKASLNYANASHAGKVIIGYHFAGGTDPVAEADFFVRSMSPLAENDILCLDWEVHPAGKDPVQWCLSFVNRVHEKTGLWCWVYMNMSTANAYDWSPVFKNCGYWCAAPSYSFNATLPVKYPQIAQQGPIVNGLDTDAFFGSLDQLKKYGYHAPVAVPAPLNTPSPSVSPSSSASASSSPSASASPSDSPELALEKDNNNLLKQILAIVQAILIKITGVFR